MQIIKTHQFRISFIITILNLKFYIRVRSTTKMFQLIWYIMIIFVGATVVASKAKSDEEEPKVISNAKKPTIRTER